MDGSCNSSSENELRRGAAESSKQLAELEPPIINVSSKAIQDLNIIEPKEEFLQPLSAAQFLQQHPALRTRSTIQRLDKGSALDHARTCGLGMTPAHKAPEIKAALADYLFPARRTTAQRQVKGLASKSKDQLVERAQELGVVVTHRMTKAQLQEKIRLRAMENDSAQAQEAATQQH